MHAVHPRRSTPGAIGYGAYAVDESPLHQYVIMDAIATGIPSCTIAGTMPRPCNAPPHSICASIPRACWVPTPPWCSMAAATHQSKSPHRICLVIARPFYISKAVDTTSAPSTVAALPLADSTPWYAWDNCPSLVMPPWSMPCAAP